MSGAGAGAATAWRETAGSLILDLRVQPGARTAGIVGLETRDDGRTRLKVKVTAAPEAGKANAAVALLLAKALGLAPRDVALLRGETTRDKTLSLVGDPADLARRLAALVGGGR
ncbi:hypothetical protein SAMN06265365_13426 [Tistlia consotensis]|uniref:UPF0235 protein SAMN05428998_13926 n=1 Tax=Tistlia consotensis USBA 355 TaxID=560819 RepID=A0A1Y6CN21_9PROT|nr:DUF167 family protein [Tistlia consotensis]SMF78939.1 hypothetical protein SAMN05428998_13926 [Tistlia consotensis USBA 355]SNS15339.1 hypothetical protein SAMN06265365_13426 [Tistlia consotensis]